MTARSIIVAALLGSALLFGSSCGGGGSGVKVASLEIQPSDSEAMKAAKTKFKILCSTCHGLTGKGDGPAAPPEPKPRSFGDPTWQTSVDDQKLYNVILGGGAAVGMSPLMPPNPDLNGKDDVINALIAIVRAFGDGLGEGAAK